jgi:hypothetical protein
MKSVIIFLVFLKLSNCFLDYDSEDTFNCAANYID